MQEEEFVKAISRGQIITKDLITCDNRKNVNRRSNSISNLLRNEGTAV